MSETLVAQIVDAFSEVSYPGDTALCDSTYGEEPEALRRAFRGKTDWTILEAQFLDQAPEGWSTSLSFFSYAALQFYLPAYILADLRGELQSQSPDSRLCLPLTPQFGSKRLAARYGGGTIAEHAQRGYALFTSAQARAIVSYLWWKLEQPGVDSISIEQALESYWLERAEVEPIEDDAC